MLVVVWYTSHMLVRFKLEGKIPSKKNRWSVGRGGRVYIPEDVKSELDGLLFVLNGVRSKNRIKEPIEGDIKIELVFHGKENYRKDLDNLSTTVFDLLQKARIIKNDKDVVCMFAMKFNIGENGCEVTLSTL